ncbi:hypothetical protein WICPIJ_010057 [Wickerhamomyces pijperi]|uniref:Uncharacterized protein n=1 Tax=Wickerhamomyces pijperi TaxID=599730 RepID=A0A9P8PJE3_WICPI|nr:hypothetical protein WICPIJ_010057 [Wickerhamomyces pijperi]
MLEGLTSKRPRTRHVTHGVPTTTKHHQWHTQVLTEIHTVGVALHGKVEATESVTGKRITTTLQDNGGWLVPFHDLGDDRLKDGLVGGVVNTVTERNVNGIVLTLANTNVTELTGPWEELTVFVERAGHDSVCGVEGLFNTVTVMHVDINVQHSWVVS